MVPDKVKVPLALLMFTNGRLFEPPPVKVCAPVPSINRVAEPVAPAVTREMFALAAIVPVLMVTG